MHIRLSKLKHILILKNMIILKFLNNFKHIFILIINHDMDIILYIQINNISYNYRYDIDILCHINIHFLEKQINYHSHLYK